MPYQVARNGRPYADAVNLPHTLKWVKQAAGRVGPPYRIGKDGDRIGMPRLLSTLAVLLPGRGTPSVTHIFAGDKPVEFLIKKVPAPSPLLYYTGQPVNMDQANERLQEIGSWLAENFTHIRCNGWLFSRPVAGTDTPSQHSAWPPVPGYSNAGDFSAYKDDTPAKGADVPYIDAAFHGLLREAKANRLMVWRIIWEEHDYRYDHDFQPIAYSGVRHSTHFHVEARPVQTGTPLGWT